MRDAAAVTAEDGSGRVNSVADNLRDWSRLVGQTLQGGHRRPLHHHAFMRGAVLTAGFRTP